MRLFFLTALTMCAFAANSVLNRLAVGGGWIGPLDFAAMRLGSGAVALWLLAAGLGRPARFSGRSRLVGAAALLAYMLGFSLAYLALPAGVGALILFGGVQITMFAGALLSGEALPPRRWAGAGLAFAGLAWLLWPGAGGGAAPLPALSMAVAAFGWGVYSLAGRREGDALAATAANFVLAAPVAVLVAIAVAAGGGAAGYSGQGIGLALVSGIVTSGLGYALWYAILPALGAGRAAVAQLTVPVIAALGGVALLGEAPGLRFLMAAALVLGGVGLAAMPMPRAAR
ncbi:MAG: DMT family transporter [Proteobacteria bacterium]|nr:DMT family transporter [Pseudomonadota bacterium]